MNENNQTKQVSTVFEEPVSNIDYIGRQIDSMFEREHFRTRVNNVIEEHTNSVPFMEKVQGYADKQIDIRIFKSVRVVLGLIAGWVASIAIAAGSTVPTRQHFARLTGRTRRTGMGPIRDRRLVSSNGR